MENYDTSHNYNAKGYDTVNMMQMPMNARSGYKPTFYTGWGYSTHQQQPEMAQQKNSAQILNMNKANDYYENKDMEFERAIPPASDFEYQPKRNKSPSLYSDMNFGEEQKFDVRNSYMFN